MLLASYMVAGFVVASVYAVGMLRASPRGREPQASGGGEAGGREPQASGRENLR